MEVLLCFFGSCCIQEITSYVEGLTYIECCKDDTLLKFFLDLQSKQDFLRPRVHHFADKVIQLQEIIEQKSKKEQLDRLKENEEIQKKEHLTQFYQ